jgi:hypothetical protein
MRDQAGVLEPSKSNKSDAGRRLRRVSCPSVRFFNLAKRFQIDPKERICPSRESEPRLDPTTCQSHLYRSKPPEDPNDE